MTNLEKLTKIITDEIPEILELKFGCEILGINKNLKKEVGRFVFWRDKKEGTFIAEYKDTFSYEVHTVKTKIIGRPITLADCVRVIKTREDRNWSEYSKILNKWNLEKDLNNQSPETIDFLLNILS